jgi:hypothetical protein
VGYRSEGSGPGDGRAGCPLAVLQEWKGRGSGVGVLVALDDRCFGSGDGMEDGRGVVTPVLINGNGGNHSMGKDCSWRGQWD